MIFPGGAPAGNSRRAPEPATSAPGGAAVRPRAGHRATVTGPGMRYGCFGRRSRAHSFTSFHSRER